MPDSHICLSIALHDIAGRYASEYHNVSQTCNSGGSSKKTEIGFIAAAIAVIFFGSQYLPVKKFDTGDGK